MLIVGVAGRVAASKASPLPLRLDTPWHRHSGLGNHNRLPCITCLANLSRQGNIRKQARIVFICQVHAALTAKPDLHDRSLNRHASPCFESCRGRVRNFVEHLNGAARVNQRNVLRSGNPTQNCVRCDSVSWISPVTGGISTVPKCPLCGFNHLLQPLAIGPRQTIAVFSRVKNAMDIAATPCA